MVSKMHIPGTHEFTVTDTELLLESPILGVRRDSLIMPGGSTARREVVEHFGAVAVVAFDGENIAMVKQYRRSVGIPCGSCLQVCWILLMRMNSRARSAGSWRRLVWRPVSGPCSLI